MTTARPPLAWSADKPFGSCRLIALDSGLWLSIQREGTTRTMLNLSAGGFEPGVHIILSQVWTTLRESPALGANPLGGEA